MSWDLMFMLGISFTGYLLNGDYLWQVKEAWWYRWSKSRVVHVLFCVNMFPSCSKLSRDVWRQVPRDCREREAPSQQFQWRDVWQCQIVRPSWLHNARASQNVRHKSTLLLGSPTCIRHYLGAPLPWQWHNLHGGPFALAVVQPARRRLILVVILCVKTKYLFSWTFCSFLVVLNKMFIPLFNMCLYLYLCIQVCI